MSRAIIVLTIASLLVTAANADDWPQWRGPNLDGISAEKDFRKNWGEKTPPRLWLDSAGAAFSGFACVAGKAYTCGTSNEKQVAYCYDAHSGKRIWKTPFEDAYEEGQGGDGPRATPAVFEGRVYLQGALGRVVCLDAADGKIIWSQSFDKKPTWGYSASVLIEGDFAIVTGNNELIALDKTTGERKWSCETEVVGYATPYPFTFADQRYIAAFMGKEAVIVTADTGREVFRMPWQTDWDVNAATPIFSDGHLFLSSGYRHGSILLKLRKDGDKLAADTVWQNGNIRAKFQTPVLYEGYLYTSDEVGIRCVHFLTGEEQWKVRGKKHGTLVIADGHIVLLTEDGELQIAPASPGGYEPVTTARVMRGRCWTVPTLYDGKLYVRNLKAAACYDLRGS